MIIKTLNHGKEKFKFYQGKILCLRRKILLKTVESQDLRNLSNLAKILKIDLEILKVVEVMEAMNGTKQELKM